MAATRTILVMSASGNIGSELVPLLAKEANVKLVLPTRSVTRLRSSIPASNTSTTVFEEGEISNPIWFESLLTKYSVDSVFLCIHGGTGSELDMTLNILEAMRNAPTVKQCVYVGICGDFASPAGIERFSRDCSAGHMLVKIPIEAKLKHGGFAFDTTVLGPSLFFSNDMRTKQSLLQRGFFDEPVDRSSRVSPADIALAARNIMFASPPNKYAGRKIQIGSRHVFSNAEIAEVWSKALGREVAIWGTGREEMDRFETENVQAGRWPAGFTRDIRLMYESFAAMGFGMSEEEYREQVEVLGKEADDYARFAERTARMWLEEERSGK